MGGAGDNFAEGFLTRLRRAARVERVSVGRTLGRLKAFVSDPSAEEMKFGAHERALWLGFTALRWTDGSRPLTSSALDNSLHETQDGNISERACETT